MTTNFNNHFADDFQPSVGRRDVTGLVDREPDARTNPHLGQRWLGLIRRPARRLGRQRGCETMHRVGTERERARVLHGQVVELVEAARSDELPVGPAFRHRLEGGITALEAVLGLPPSLSEDVFSSLEREVK